MPVYESVEYIDNILMVFFNNNEKNAESLCIVQSGKNRFMKKKKEWTLEMSEMLRSFSFGNVNKKQ